MTHDLCARRMFSFQTPPLMSTTSTKETKVQALPNEFIHFHLLVVFNVMCPRLNLSPILFATLSSDRGKVKPFSHPQ